MPNDQGGLFQYIPPEPVPINVAGDPIQAAEQQLVVDNPAAEIAHPGLAPPPNHLWAPQLGVMGGAGMPKPKKAFIQKAIVNPALPKMEFNTEAKKAKVWFRVTTRDQVKEALINGHVIYDQMYDDAEDAISPWNPFKFPDVNKISGTRIKLLQVYPDKKYLLYRLATIKLGNASFVSTVFKNEAKLFEKWEADMTAVNKFVEWMGLPNFLIVNKDVGHV